MSNSSGHIRSLRVSTLVTAILIAVAVIAGCTESDKQAKPTDEISNSGAVEDVGDAPERGGRITYGLLGESDGWNPVTTVWSMSGMEVSRAVFDTLTTFGSDSEPQPNLAESVTADETFTTWTIKLRNGVRLHNGRSVDAAVVVENLDLMRTSALFAPALEPINSVTASDPMTVTITTSRPWVALPYLLTTQIGVVADPDWLRSGDPSNPVGTGPFRFVSWVPGASLMVHRNDAWWRSDDSGTPLPYLDEIEFIPVTDMNARAARLEAGRLDMMQTATGDHVTRFRPQRNENAEEIRRKVDYQVFTDAGGEKETTFLQLNTAMTPFDNPLARTALALGTDPADFVKSIERNQYEPAIGPFADTSPWFHDGGQPTADRDTATEAAAEVSAANGGSFTFKILVPPTTHLLDTAVYFQERWRKLGIEALIDIAPSRSSFDARVATGDYQVTIRSGFGSPSPFIDALSWHPSALRPLGEPSLNSARIDDQDVAVAVDQASADPDRARQVAFFAVTQQRLAEDLPYIWLFHGVRGVVAAPSLVNVTNWTLPDGNKGLDLDRGTHPLYQVWKTS